MIRLTRQEVIFGVVVLISVLIGVTVRQFRHSTDHPKQPLSETPVLPVSGKN